MASNKFSSSISVALEGRPPKEPEIQREAIIKPEPKIEPSKIEVPKPKAPIKNESKNVIFISFGLTEEETSYIRRYSIKNRITKEKLFDDIFRSMLSETFDENDPDYIEFTKQVKGPVTHTTRIDEKLYKTMQDIAANQYLRIGGYINLVIRKYKKLHNA